MIRGSYICGGDEDLIYDEISDDDIHVRCSAARWPPIFDNSDVSFIIPKTPNEENWFNLPIFDEHLDE